MRNALPVILLQPEECPDGTLYHPANGAAVALAELAGHYALHDKHLPLIEKLGFQIAFPNGQPLPFPRGAYKRPQPEPLHVRDEA